MYSAFNIFWEKINKINQNIKNNNIESKSENIKNQSNLNTIEMKEIKELGLEDFPKNKEINILEGFYTVIKNKIYVTLNGDKFNIHQINICYKISEFMKIEEQIQKIKGEIYKINHDSKQKEKNENLKLKDNNRKYFYYPLDILEVNILTCKLCEKYHIYQN